MAIGKSRECLTFFTCGDCCPDGKHLSYRGATQCERSRTALEMVDMRLRGELKLDGRPLLNIVQWPMEFQRCANCSHEHRSHRYGYECFKCWCSQFEMEPVGMVGEETTDGMD